LKLAKSRKLVSYDGDVLVQGVNDSVRVTALATSIAPSSAEDCLLLGGEFFL
jgi:hypothetical protein